MTKTTTTKKTKPTTVRAKSSQNKTTPKPIKKLPPRPLAFEVLDLVSKQRTKAKKIEVLKTYEDISLKVILIWNFDESVQSVLPPGDVPYSGYDDQNTYSGTLSTKITEEDSRMHETGSFSLGTSDKQGHTTIRREARNFYRFVKGGQDSLSNLRRETMFINVLTGLHPLEAEILVLVKDGKLEERYNISKDVVSEAFPDIIWGDA